MSLFLFIEVFVQPKNNKLRIAGIIILTTIVVSIILGGALRVLLGSSSWVSYTDNEGRFTANFPNQPKKKIKTVNSVAGLLNMYNVVCSRHFDEQEFGVVYTDYDPGMPGLANPDAFLDRVSTGSGTSTRVVLEVKPTSLQGYPGRSVVCSKLSNGRYIKLQERLYLVKNRFYIVIVTGNDVPAADVERFLNSFKLED